LMFLLSYICAKLEKTRKTQSTKEEQNEYKGERTFIPGIL
ncbi:hypothetical protein C818_02141, partial [Lachnospiraceae bacterium MD308]